MCMQPTRLADGTAVACHNCKLCRRNRLEDYVGRCMAEAEASKRVLAATLTYRTGHPHAHVLVYRDVQRMMKLLRKHDYSVRYIVAGEYGHKTERAHWHIIMFLQCRDPDCTTRGWCHCVEFFDRKTGKPLSLNANVHWRYWADQTEDPKEPGEPTGFVQFKAPHLRSFRYLLKYVLKTPRGEFRASNFGLSKKPPLGHSFLISLARHYAAQGSLPPSPFYDVRGKRYWLSNSSRDAFLLAYASAFASLNALITPSILPDWASETIEKNPGLFAGFYDRLPQGVPRQWSRKLHKWVYEDGWISPKEFKERTEGWGLVGLPSRARVLAQFPAKPELVNPQSLRHASDTCRCPPCCAGRQGIPLIWLRHATLDYLQAIVDNQAWNDASEDRRREAAARLAADRASALFRALTQPDPGDSPDEKPARKGFRFGRVASGNRRKVQPPPDGPQGQ